MSVRIAPAAGVPPRRDAIAGDRRLVGAAALFTVAVLFHGADHVRRGTGSSHSDVFWAGTAAIGLEVAIVLLACQRHRWAPVVAAAGGLSLAVGYVVVHFLPARSWLSDSFPSATGVSPLSWLAASLEVLAAVVVGVAGVVALRERSAGQPGAAGPPTPRSVNDALRHPAAAAMIAGNAVILVLSFVR